MDGTDLSVVQTQPESDSIQIIDSLVNNIESIIYGKTDVIRLAVTTLLAGGHLLIEDIPGVGKSTLAQALARSVGGTFRRIQFTSDMLPSDIIGVSVFKKESDSFEFVPGPIFANFVLADEINRTSPRTQSALLEAMNDARVSIENTTHRLPWPFMILATQNPLESHGTYPLPESQLDRFMMSITIGYPNIDDEMTAVISQGRETRVGDLKTVMNTTELELLQRQVDQIHIHEDVMNYLMRLVDASRRSKHIRLGVSTRGAIFFKRAAQASALMNGRSYVTPGDVKDLVMPVFTHRVLLATSSLTERDRVVETSHVLNEIIESQTAPY